MTVDTSSPGISRDTPRSPVTRLPNQLTNWAGTDSFSPHASR